ncbi:MAG: hypothetical protein HRT36_07375, partial [Alphaproteobacteria bacterium]|nr:hypothetical protein [Alphaproteobacteria bacterium]
VNMILIDSLYNATFIIAGIYTNQEGFNLFKTLLFDSILIFAPTTGQTLIGRLSDCIDRRLVIILPLLICITILISIIRFPDISTAGKFSQSNY